MNPLFIFLSFITDQEVINDQFLSFLFKLLHNIQHI